MQARRFLLAAVFVALALPQRAPAGVPDDLRLDHDAEAWRRLEPGPNPHAAMPCTDCHVRGGLSYESARRFGIRIPLTSEGESSIVLCEQCHRDYHAFHPVNFPVRRHHDDVERAAVFPLESPLENYDKLTCTSCHVVHAPHAAARLLRGFPVDPRSDPGGFRTRLDFCVACHGRDEIVAFSGHRQTAGDAGCALCHAAPLKPEIVGMLKSGLNGTCAICHPPAPGEPPHYAAYNPFPGLAPDDAAGAGAPRPEPTYTCASCHRHHRPTPATPAFKARFVKAAGQSPLVNPHRSSRFCLNCHTEDPPPPGTPGAAAPLVDADVTRLCQRCHDREGALQMRHPLAPPSPATAVPEGWPLRADGTLGCQTCHLAGHGPQDAANPRFLRGGPYQRRNQVCFACHADRGERFRNVHAEVGQGGACDVCHERPAPTADAEQTKVGPVVAEPNLLCLVCHAVTPHPGSANHTVRPRPTAFLTIDASLAPLTLGKVTCHSCHDSHAGVAADHLLRLNGRPLICANCHPF